MLKISIIVLTTIYANLVYADFFDFFSGRSVPSVAVSDLNVRQASCLSSSIYNIEAPQAQLEKVYNDLGASEKIRAISVNGKFFQNVRSSYVNLYYDIAGYSRYQMANECSDMKCEVKAFFGEEYTLKLAYINKQFGFNTSYISTESASFTYEELDLIIWTFSQLPDFMFKGKLKKIIKKNEYLNNDPSVLASMSTRGVMTLYAPWARKSNEMKSYTLIHEFGHYIGEAVGIHNTMKWLKLSGWENIQGSDVNRANNLVSKYASDSHLEDFAESFSAYRLNPTLLKSVAPKKYQLLKEMVFLGIDYIENICESDIADKSFGDANLDVGELLSECKNSIIGYKLGLKDIQDARGCLMDNADKIKMKSMDIYGGTYSSQVKKNMNDRGYPFFSFNKKTEIVSKIMEGVEALSP